MKKFILLWLLLICASTSFAQLKCYVDERYELSSIAFRLAGAEEYVNNEVTGYAEDIDKYFAKYKDHPLILYVKYIREKYEICYGLVPGVAYLLQIKNNKIELKKDVDIDCFLNIGTRWTRDTLLKYVNLLNKFYQDTRFQQFFDRHKPLYAETEKRFNAHLATIHTEWFSDFFGKSLGNVDIVVSLTNGRSNYGGLPSCLPDPSKSIIIGCPKIDEEGIPTFANSYDGSFDHNIYSTLIHELCHTIGNPIIDKYEANMKPAVDSIFPYVKKQLAAVAYNDSGMIGEGLTDLFTNMYFKEYPTGWEPYNIKSNEIYGFIFMRRAVSFMDNFYQNRDIYPYIEDFMPQIVSFMNFCGSNARQIVYEYEHSHPYVVNVYPALNSTVPVDIKEIKVKFNDTMWNSVGVSSLSDSALINPCLGYYDENHKQWSDDKLTYSIPVKLEKGKNYGFKLLKGVFLSSETFPMKEDFEIRFKTEE